MPTVSKKVSPQPAYKIFISSTYTDINTYMKQHWTSVDDAYRFALVTELIRDGLITGSKRSKTSGLNGHNLSTLGERFLEYIFSPNEPYDVK